MTVRYAIVPEPRVDACWALLGPSRKPLTCGIHWTDAGLEIRVGYPGRKPLYARGVREMVQARAAAAHLRNALNSEGVFEEVFDRARMPR